MWTTLAILLFLLLVGLAYFVWMRDRRYQKKKTSEVMGESVWRDIVAEREAALQKRRAFQKALDEAKHKGPQ